MAPSRLTMIDGIRGHLLLGMMIAHLYMSGAPVVGTFHHVWLIDMWDAEFFVLISGGLCGYLSFNKYGLAGRLRRFLGGRAGLLLVHVLFGQYIFFALISPHEFSMDRMVSIALLQEGSFLPAVLEMYFYCFILLFILTLVVPNVAAMLALSLALYAAGHHYEERGVFGYGSSAFNLATWQFLFMLGFAFGWYEHRVRRVVKGLRAPSLYLAIAALAALFIAMMPTDPQWPIVKQEEAPTWLARDHLDPSYLIRILLFSAAMYLLLASGRENPVTHLVRAWFSLPFLQRLGQASLRCFTFHVVLVAAFIAYQERWSQDHTLPLALVMLALFIAFPYASKAFELRLQGWRRMPQRDFEPSD